VPELTSTVGRVAEAVGGRVVGDPDVVPTSVTHASDRVSPGALFCCVRGQRVDGHDFAPDAVARGAVALLVERELTLDVPQVVVADSRAAMAPAAATVLGRPAERLRVIGVTGTNGKTTVVSMIGHVLSAAGRTVDVIGTLTGERTTPEATDLQARLADDLERGVTDVAVEVSSHALVLHRVDAIEFAVGVFTNLGTDHLDFHGSPEAYFAAKARLFDPGRCRAGLVNLDDVHGRLLFDASGRTLHTYRLDDAADLRSGPSGSTFTWRDRSVTLPVPGLHNVSNALAAAEACRLVGCPEDVIAEALSSLPPVPGRLERVDDGGPFTVLVDYAHTPDALESVLTAARDLAGGARVTVVFGCGGDRDRSKRPLMGRVASEMADLVVLTDDNPRSEDPASIRAEVRAGCIPGRPVEEVADRRAAIARALARAQPGDVVVIAGKGHEQGQTVGTRTVPFDDRQVAREELARRDGEPAA
jgi:UDP-N-acetylmuramoyl-L-alanyl-D-glutamate--2,6-diaminopimelate ligase